MSIYTHLFSVHFPATYVFSSILHFEVRNVGWRAIASTKKGTKYLTSSPSLI